MKKGTIFKFIEGNYKCFQEINRSKRGLLVHFEVITSLPYRINNKPLDFEIIKAQKNFFC